MARGFNLAVIVGNVARDPEVRYTASKQAVAKFAVAVNRKWKGQNGEIHEEVDFIPVSAWGAQAENCEKYLRKGSAVLVEGRIRVSSYEKDGQKRTFTEIVNNQLIDFEAQVSTCELFDALLYDFPGSPPSRFYARQAPKTQVRETIYSDGGLFYSSSRLTAATQITDTWISRSDEA